MIINSFTSANIATSVWTSATRTLSSYAVLISTLLSSPSIAANATQDYRPAATKYREVNMGPGASANVQFGTYDGVTFTSFTGAGSTVNTLYWGQGLPTLGWSAHNNSAGALSINAHVMEYV
jgi:hypothetical protein